LIENRVYFILFRISKLFKISPKANELIKKLSSSKQDIYLLFELEKKSIEEIALKKSLASSTIHSYLEDAILVGLPFDYSRLNISLEQIDYVEQKIRLPPINSSNRFFSSLKTLYKDNVKIDSTLFCTYKI
jgi:hypothetical protein